MSRQNKIILIIAAIMLVVGLTFAIKDKKSPQNNQEQNNGGEYQADKVRPIGATDHVFGDPKAPAQIIVYSDFQCPFCAQFVGTIKEVEENFKDKVVIAFRHYPLAGHVEALAAAQASECAGEQGKFWEMHDKLFADNVAGRMSVEQFKQDAADLNLNQEQFNQCLDSNKYKDKISEQTAEGDKAGVTGVPTVFVNGNIYPGAYPFEDFTTPDGKKELGLKSIISELLK